jgi:hypothetical protein
LPTGRITKSDDGGSREVDVNRVEVAFVGTVAKPDMKQWEDLRKRAVSSCSCGWALAQAGTPLHTLLFLTLTTTSEVR